MRRDPDNQQVYDGYEKHVGHGNVHFNGSTKLVMWILGIFGTVLTVLLTLVLQAVYTSNGDIHELKGKVEGIQVEVNNLVTGRSGVMRGSP